MPDASPPVDISTRKRDLRQRMRALRRATAATGGPAAADAVAQRLLALAPLRDAVVFFTYVGVASEVATAPLIAALLAGGRTVLVPRCGEEPGAMDAVPVPPLADLVPGPHRIPQPRGDAEAWRGAIDVAVVPGLAFDRRGHRLGSGAGCYDRFLAHRRPRHVVGLAFDVQLADALPVEPHDVPVDYIVTPTRTLRPAPPRRPAPKRR